ncbi:phage tail spike protein [Bacillus subtilis]|uniref:phage tail spike protein n=1 Tax=Bacillus subtilis TaxID=1423 RepID=UPI002DB8979B|nr:phage tail spike protein [Bacillus subtilis]MEC3621535.1 phage tail spike protein [Bacillus subtilis]MEC3633382.1 phage tail spike protein [Bacillus subtilis]MEC3643872.1 phage tail spike protein [Bacillus subtilis]MEC3648867.1 phage tail spike protein [Bacillus subtilis]MEC3698977.1 phage tail spike protein [Bacillus subtilis]
MADMWVLDRYDNPLAILSSDAEDDACTFHSDQFLEKLNQGTEFSFSCDARHEDSLHVTKLNQVVFRDEDGFFRLFKIREIDRGNGDNGAEKIAHCEPAEMELLEAIVEDVRPTGKTQQYALDRVLEGTRWKGNVTAQTGTQSTNFYHISAYEAITKIIEVWGGELRFTVNFDEENNKIIERVVNIEQRRGNDEGDRFEVGYNVESITVTEMAYPVSALYGWGGSVETENGGDSRYIDFADVEWKVSNGDPADKPKGQKWIELPGAKEKYGYKKSDGAFINSFGQWQDENITDPKELLQKTYEHLRDTASKPQATYELKVIPTDHISLGDTRTAIDDTQADSIQIQSRVIALGYSISNPAGTKTVEMGEFLEVYQPDRRLDDLEDKVKNIDRNVQVTDGSFPDIIPKVPSNVTVKGLFSGTSITWDYDPSSYIAAYEVYGSQTTGFIPSIENRLWRGKQSGYLHENAGVDNVWYYRIRAVNYHGKASEFTAEFSAKTQRIMTDDILFSAVTADKLANLAVTADAISRNFEEANILPGSLLRLSDILRVDSRVSVNEVNGFNELSVTKDTTEYTSFGFTTGGRNSLKLTKGETYTLSFELKRETLNDFSYIQVRSKSGTQYNLTNNFTDLSSYPTDEFVRFDLPFVSPATLTDGRVCLGGRTQNLTDSANFTIRKVQIRKGNVRMHFGFSPYDTQLTDGAVTSAIIADAAITSAKVAEAAIGTAAIQNAAIARAHLQEAIIDTVHIADAAITSAKIKELSADLITSGTIKAINITGSLIRGGKFQALNTNKNFDSYFDGDKFYQYKRSMDTGTYAEYTMTEINSALFYQESGKDYQDGDEKEIYRSVSIGDGKISVKGSGKFTNADNMAVVQMYGDFNSYGDGTGVFDITNSTTADIPKDIFVLEGWREGIDVNDPYNANFTNRAVISGSSTLLSLQPLNFETVVKGGIRMKSSKRTVFEGAPVELPKKSTIMPGDDQFTTPEKIVGGNVTSLVTDIHGALQNNLCINVSQCTVTVGSGSYGYGYVSYPMVDGNNQGAENVFAVMATPYGKNANNVTAGIMNQTANGFQVHVRGTGAKDVTNERITVRLVIFYEKK